MLSAVKVGSLTMSMAVPAWYSNFMKRSTPSPCPISSARSKRLRTALDGSIGTEIGKLGDGAGSRCSAIGSSRPAYRHKVRPIEKPADCQGLKIRVINSQVYIQAFRAMGASTVAMDPSEPMSGTAAKRHRRLRVSAARSRRLQALRGPEIPLARRPQYRLLHQLDQQGRLGRSLAEEQGIITRR